MGSVKFQTITETQWDEIPVQKSTTQKVSPWDEVIEQLIEGKVIALPIDDEKDLRGIRIGVARRGSKAYGVKFQFRYDSEKRILAIRLAGDIPETDEPKKPVGRPKKA